MKSCGKNGAQLGTLSGDAGTADGRSARYGTTASPMTGERCLDLAQVDEVCEASTSPLEDLARRYKAMVVGDEDS